MHIVVKDFQSLNTVDLQVAGLTVLVGPSSRGKSALVRAVEAALFNKPGDGFVRTGQKRAIVGIEQAPAVGGKTLDPLSWVKGGGKTVYVIGGETFGKVQGGTPPPVTEAGYRDIWIGDKDRKKGEWLRPQVSAQHDPIFLLTRSGSFVSDVLGAISRHAVLLTAQGRATGDQRSTKQQLGYKQTDLATAQTQLDALADVPALAARVERLVDAYARRDVLAAKVERIKALLARRALYQPVAAATVDQWVGYGIHEGMDTLELRFAGYQRAAQLAAHRPLRLALGGSELPGEVTPALGHVDALVAAYAKAKGLLGHRPHVAALASAFRVIKSDASFTFDPLDRALALRQSVAAVVAQRAPALDRLKRCETAVASTKVEVDEANAALATLLASVEICPTCDRPWPR